MMKRDQIPTILIIDDLFGRILPDRRNEERSNLCGQYLIEDITGDEVNQGVPRRIRVPIARAVFFRGQRPVCACVGDTVENDLKATLEVIRQGWHNPPSGTPRWAMVLLDLCFYTGEVSKRSDQETCGMPEGRSGDDDPQQYFGLQLLRAMYREFPELPVVIFSSKPRGAVSKEFSSKGALGFLSRDAVQGAELLKEFLWRHALIPDEEGEVVGQSIGLLKALRMARRSADGRQNILLRGERGTGKGLLARYIHRQRQKNAVSSFVEVNSSVLTPELFASELFGYRKGAFTGAAEDKIGLLKTADGGDLFFDEIKDMLPQVQAGILRVLEEHSFTPIGSEKTLTADVRFLSATNGDIEAMAVAGEFRPDLLDRLREGGTVFLPPLSERKEDVPALAEFFVRQAEAARPGARHRQIEPEAMEKLLAHGWPGNVREFRNCIVNAVNNNPDVEHLYPLHLQLPGEGLAPRMPGTDEEAEVPTDMRATGGYGVNNVNHLLNVIESFSFESEDVPNLAGRLPAVQGACARLMARYLAEVLKATSKATLQKPEGELLIHPALKLMTGDAKLTASKAADIIKRILQMDSEAVERLMSEPVLRDAYEKALRLRPKSSRKKEI